MENNLVVAATDMPDYDDRKELEGEDEEQATHYSKTLVSCCLFVSRYNRYVNSANFLHYVSAYFFRDVTISMARIRFM